MGSMGGRTGVPGGEGLFCAVLCLDCCGQKLGFPFGLRVSKWIRGDEGRTVRIGKAARRGNK